MNVNELYDHITKSLTPEEALKRLLSSSLHSYEKLKFEKGKEVDPLIIMTMAALDMGWDIAVERDQEIVRGLIVGTKEYMNVRFPEEKDSSE